MALKDIGASLKDATVLNQLAGALLIAAAQIVTESADADNHVNRLGFANAVLGNPFAAAAFIAPGLFTNPVIQSEAGGAVGPSGTSFSDNDVQFVINSIWDTYANQYAAQSVSGAALTFGQ
jgi:hypothetical protein